MDKVPVPPRLPGGAPMRQAQAIPLPTGVAVGGANAIPGMAGLSNPAGDDTKTPANAEEAAKDFAGILFGYMFSEMRSKQDEEEGVLGGGDSEMFMNLFDQAVGRHLADQAGDPLVEALVKKMARPEQK